MLELVREISRKGAGFKSLAESGLLRASGKNETGLNPMVELILTSWAASPQFERAVSASASARASTAQSVRTPRYHGRPPSFDAMEIRRLAAEGLSKSEIARRLGCHRSTVHRALEAPVS